MTRHEAVSVPDRSRSSDTASGGAPVAKPLPQDLTPAQLHALFDILTHYETYAEIQNLKVPGYIEGYGYPFVSRAPASAPGAASCSGDDKAEPSGDETSSAPVLASLLRTFVLSAPGMRELPREFWSERFQGLMARLAEAELSESYDKGAMGTRKTLATAGSSIHESLTRGMFGGVPKDRDGARRNLNGQYDSSDADDLVQAWEDVVYELTYGDAVDELFECATEKGDLEKHSTAAKAAVDYIILHLATLLHGVFVLSPEGPYMLKLIERANKLTPWAMIRQTMRIGNVATMINGLVNILLAKMSLGALSNWIGITSNADDGMNLMQRIISVVLGWDVADFRKSAEKIEKAKGGPSKEHLAALKEFISKPRTAHDEAREQSIQQGVSIVVKIFQDANPNLVSNLTDAQHSQCLEYLSAQLSARDREEIIRALCRQTPDLFTQLARDQITAFSDLLREIHKHVDLAHHMTSLESFLGDLIATSKPTKVGSNGSKSTAGGVMNGMKNGLKKATSPSESVRAPSVEDYVELLKRNRHLLFKFLHEVARGCPDIREDARAWSNNSIRKFRQEKDVDLADTASDSATRHRADKSWDRPGCRGAAGSMSGDLQVIFSTLPGQTRGPVSEALNAHAGYLKALDDLSLRRMQRVLDNLNRGSQAPVLEPSLLPDSAFGIFDNESPTPTDTSSGEDQSDSGGISASQRDGSRGLFRKRLTGFSARLTPRDSSRSQPDSDFETPKSGKVSGAGTGKAADADNERSYCGPGVYLARWHDLMNETLITPAAATGGSVRRGKDVKAITAKGKTGHTDVKEAWDPEALTREAQREVPDAPDVHTVVDALGDTFRQLIAEKLIAMEKEKVERS